MSELRAVAVLLAVSANLSATSLPSGFTESVVASGIPSPTAMALAPDGRIFVSQQSGLLRVIKNDTLLPTPFLTVGVSTLGERGLLGVAFDPDFAVNQYVYVYYTVGSTPIHNRISRFTANGDVALSGSETIIMDLGDLSAAAIHNGGAIHFGPDGKLYVAVGDNATSTNAQTLANVFGKILRINADGTIPADNPFFAQTSGNNRAIWAMGLRNPFTFSFQPGTTRMYINDVGQGTYEEINSGAPAANYGWPNSEGPTTAAGETGPVFYYLHGTSATTGCAITGGTFYNPATVQFPPSYVGKYFFADFCVGWIRVLDPANNTVSDFASGAAAPVDFFTDDAGQLYYLARSSGAVMRIRSNADQPPQVISNPSSITVSVNQMAIFSVSASGFGTLSYQWQREGINIPGANSTVYSFAASLTDSGARFRCVVSNASGSTTSSAATLTVVTNLPPTAAIVTPGTGATYAAGTTVAFSGTGADPEDGNLPADAFTWRVDFHHADHVHPHMPDTPGISSGTFTIPAVGETAVNVFYRVYLTVRDSGGLTRTIWTDIMPRVVTLTLATNFAGLALTLDGQPVNAPVSFQSVVGIVRTIGAATPQTLGSRSYDLLGWNDQGAATHAIVTPAVSRVYGAKFSLRPLSPASGERPRSGALSPGIRRFRHPREDRPDRNRRR